MAEKHILSLEVPDVANCKVFSIRDTSQYTELLPIDCSELLITSPGFNKPALVQVTPNFDLNLAACDLGLQTANCNDQNADLPDGVYIIKYSLSPNDKVYVEYNHLRVSKILTLYYNVLCQIEDHTCVPDSDREELIAKIFYLRTLIDAAVSKVEYCASPNQGMEIYNYALKELQKLDCLNSNC
jgi:hypothetical protein